MLRAPTPDSTLDPFRGGVAVLFSNGDLAGHLAASVGTFWSPSRPLSRQWWVWFIVVWSDGVRERPFEDYPPFSVVEEIVSGTFTWEEAGPHGGSYTVEWVPAGEREGVLADLGIGARDF